MPATCKTLVHGNNLEPGPYVWCEVRDSGCGMDAEVADRIFDPFFTTKFTGRGLGMSAALGIIKGHGGGFMMETGPGQRLHHFLPFAGSSDRGDRAPPTRPPNPPEAHGGPGRQTHPGRG